MSDSENAHNFDDNCCNNDYDNKCICDPWCDPWIESWCDPSCNQCCNTQDCKDNCC